MSGYHRALLLKLAKKKLALKKIWQGYKSSDLESFHKKRSTDIGTYLKRFLKFITKYEFDFKQLKG